MTTFKPPSDNIVTQNTGDNDGNKGETKDEVISRGLRAKGASGQSAGHVTFDPRDLSHHNLRLSHFSNNFPTFTHRPPDDENERFRVTEDSEYADLPRTSLPGHTHTVLLQSSDELSGEFSSVSERVKTGSCVATDTVTSGLSSIGISIGLPDCSAGDARVENGLSSLESAELWLGSSSLETETAETTFSAPKSNGLKTEFSSPGSAEVKSGFIRSAVASTGLPSPGVGNPQLRPLGVTNTGLRSPDAGNNGLRSPGVANTELHPLGVTNTELRPPGVANNGLPTPGIGNTDLSSTSVGNIELPSPGVANTGLRPPGASNTGLLSTVAIKTGLHSAAGLHFPASVDAGLPPSASSESRAALPSSLPSPSDTKGDLQLSARRTALLSAFARRFANRTASTVAQWDGARPHEATEPQPRNETAAADAKSNPPPSWWRRFPDSGGSGVVETDASRTELSLGSGDVCSGTAGDPGRAVSGLVPPASRFGEDVLRNSEERKTKPPLDEDENEDEDEISRIVSDSTVCEPAPSGFGKEEAGSLSRKDSDQERPTGNPLDLFPASGGSEDQRGVLVKRSPAPEEAETEGVERFCRDCDIKSETDIHSFDLSPTYSWTTALVPIATRAPDLSHQSVNHESYCCGGSVNVLPPIVERTESDVSASPPIVDRGAANDVTSAMLSNTELQKVPFRCKRVNVEPFFHRKNSYELRVGGASRPAPHSPEDSAAGDGSVLKVRKFESHRLPTFSLRPTSATSVHAESASMASKGTSDGRGTMKSATCTEEKKPGEVTKTGEGKKTGERKRSGEVTKTGEGKRADEGRNPGEVTKTSERKKTGEGKKPGEVTKTGEGKRADKGRKTVDVTKPAEVPKAGEGKRADEGRKIVKITKTGEVPNIGEGKKSGEGKTTGEGITTDNKTGEGGGKLSFPTADTVTKTNARAATHPGNPTDLNLKQTTHLSASPSAWTAYSLSMEDDNIRVDISDGSNAESTVSGIQQTFAAPTESSQSPSFARRKHGITPETGQTFQERREEILGRKVPGHDGRGQGSPKDLTDEEREQTTKEEKEGGRGGEERRGREGDGGRGGVGGGDGRGGEGGQGEEGGGRGGGGGGEGGGSGGSGLLQKRSRHHSLAAVLAEGDGAAGISPESFTSGHSAAACTMSPSRKNSVVVNLEAKDERVRRNSVSILPTRPGRASTTTSATSSPSERVAGAPRRRLSSKTTMEKFLQQGVHAPANIAGALEFLTWSHLLKACERSELETTTVRRAEVLVAIPVCQVTRPGGATISVTSVDAIDQTLSHHYPSLQVLLGSPGSSSEPTSGSFPSPDSETGLLPSGVRSNLSSSPYSSPVSSKEPPPTPSRSFGSEGASYLSDLSPSAHATESAPSSLPGHAPASLPAQGRTGTSDFLKVNVESGNDSETPAGRLLSSSKDGESVFFFVFFFFFFFFRFSVVH